MADNAYQQMVFINLATKDIDAAKKFYTELGYTINEQFSDENTASVVISDSIVIMLLAEQKFAEFASKPISDSAVANEALICLSAESRAAVDELCDRALAAGGTHAKDPQDFGQMYGRSFQDPDGHHFEVMWMDPAMVQG
ncbi:glyoxalase [Streptomyces sp. YC504]|uniref:Glyoxalase n=1 Tax=Streptomyces mesophilus TaxID=1775132 RepID=A0A6G4XVZ8_9ACTN|nr:VOC family protein [Streptomyces mesophilus]NGO81756.1 glyoxalase [Streptomyces mesophilus]